MTEERIEREETVTEDVEGGRGSRRRRSRVVEKVREETRSDNDLDASGCDDSDNLRKPGRGDGANFFTETIRRSSQASAESTGGMIEAIGRGFRAYADSLTNDNILRFGLNNGFVEGTVRGYAVFFEEMAATARRVLDTVAGAPDLLDSGSSGTRRVVKREVVVGQPIDYDRLARMIADEIIAESATRAADDTRI